MTSVMKRIKNDQRGGIWIGWSKKAVQRGKS